jgi:hypothetical protein
MLFKRKDLRNMNTSNNHNTYVRGKLSLIYASSILVAILMTVASIAGLLYRTSIYPSEELVRSFVPNDVVNLFIGLPILLGSMWLTRRGKLIGPLFWMGALFFVFYNYIGYIFAAPLTWGFLLYLLLAVLSAYTFISSIISIDGESVSQRLNGAVPEKFGGGVLAGLGLLFMLRAIGVIAGAVFNGIDLPRTELAVNIADFFITPAWIISGVQLWRHQKFGYVAGLGLLFQGSMLFIGLIIFLLLQPLLTSAPFSIVDVIVVLVMGLICFIPFGLFARGVVAKGE